MDRNDKDRRHDSISAVRPFARIRIIAAIVFILVAFAVLGYRALSG